MAFCGQAQREGEQRVGWGLLGHLGLAAPASGVSTRSQFGAGSDNRPCSPDLTWPCMRLLGAHWGTKEHWESCPAQHFITMEAGRNWPASTSLLAEQWTDQTELGSVANPRSGSCSLPHLLSLLLGAAILTVSKRSCHEAPDNGFD